MKPLLNPRVLGTLVLLAVFYGIGSLTLAFLPQERNRIRRKILAALICAVGVILIII